MLNFEIFSTDNELHKLLTCTPNTPKLITKFVDFFTSQLDISTNHLKNDWENELDIQVSEEDMQNVLKIYTPALLMPDTSLFSTRCCIDYIIQGSN